MSDAQVTPQTGGFLVLWEDWNILADVRRVKAKDDKYTAEVRFSLLDSDGQPEGLLHYEPNINLSAGRALSGLARELKGKREEPPWEGMMGELSYRVLTAMRQGEPVEILSSADEIGPIEFFIHPLVAKELLTVIFGVEGTGKSQTGLLVYLMLKIPWRDNPMGLRVPNDPVKMLYLDWEGERTLVLRQWRDLCRGCGFPETEMNYRRCLMPLVDDIEEIEQHIKAVGAELIIIDSIGPATGGDLNIPSQVFAFHQAYRRLKVTGVGIAHTSKDRKAAKSVFGSVFFQALARQVWELRDAESEDNLTLGLFHKKHNYTPAFPPVAYTFTFGENSCAVGYVNPKDVADFSKKLSASSRAYDYLLSLKGRHAENKALAQALDLDVTTLRSALNRAKYRNGDRKFFHYPDGWGILATEDSQGLPTFESEEENGQEDEDDEGDEVSLL